MPAVQKVTPAPTPKPATVERPVAQKPRETSLPVMRGSTVDFGII